MASDGRDRLELLDRIHGFPVLRHLPPSQLHHFLSGCTRREFRAGSRLIEEGSDGDRVFLILGGTVTVAKALPSGEEVVLAQREAGDWIGEMALVDRGPRSASASARTAGALLEVPGDLFLKTLGASEEALRDLLRTTTNRLRESDRATIEALTRKNEELGAKNRRLSRENRRLRSDLDVQYDFEHFVGGSRAARAVRATARRAAASQLPVLLLGESGTGKEILARAIHAGSDRAPRSFVPLNCALLNETLLESELFGHLRGAFTGAVATKPGLVEEAEGGTLFLDEIAEMPRAIQAALLRFLELGEYRRVGDTRNRWADVRIIAATNIDLEAAANESRFRSDLLYRLDVVRLAIPPLRERPDDIPMLLRHLSERVAQRLGVAPLRFRPEILGPIVEYPFPGNVRELENEIERLYAADRDGIEVGPGDLSPKFAGADPDRVGGYSEAVRAFKTRLVHEALRASGGNRAEAASRLGLHRSNLARLVRDLGLRAGSTSGGRP